jgi:hypothetical protein
MILDGVKIFRENTEDTGEKIFAEYPNGKIYTFGNRTIANYYKAIKKHER